MKSKPTKDSLFFQAKYYLAILSIVLSCETLKAEKYDSNSNAYLAVYYHGRYEAHYTATLPANLKEKGCLLDFQKDLKLYQYRYFTNIPLPKRNKTNNQFLKIFKYKHTEKTIKEDLKKYYKQSKALAWKNIRQSLAENLGKNYESIKTCIAFENLNFNAIVIEEIRR